MPGLKRFSPVLFLALALSVAPAVGQDADLIVVADRIWTGDEANPWAEAIATRGDRILAVGPAAEVMLHRAPHTRVVEEPDAFVTPGFIDSHTHFDQAGALLLGVNLLEVSDAATLRERVREARDRLAPGAWILGGDWGAYEAWHRGSTGREEGGAIVFDPDRSQIDPVTPDTPTLLWRWDRSAYLANGAALAAAGAECGWEDLECVDGWMTGRVTGEALARIRRVIPERTLEQRMAEGRTAMARLRSLGVTTIHDITPPEQFEVYEALRSEGALTTRVYARPTLDKWRVLAAAGIRHGFGDDWIRIGGLKGFVDGIMGNSTARFYEPYRTTGHRGAWRDSTNTGAAGGPGSGMEPPGTMLSNLLGADAAGHWPQVHAIGDEAIDTLLDLMEEVERVNGPSDRRFRVIHAQVLHGPDVARRMAAMGVIAEMQPYHAIDDMRWMEERIGERARWAYAFRTLNDAGVRLSFGSDWPGTNASWYPANPVQGIYAAVTRQTLEGEPRGGWFPDERIDVETALRAYTVNNAYAEGEEDRKGRLRPGMLADLVVLDRDLFRSSPAGLRDASVLYTVVGGQIVYTRAGTAAE